MVEAMGYLVDLEHEVVGPDRMVGPIVQMRRLGTGEIASLREVGALLNDPTGSTTPDAACHARRLAVDAEARVGAPGDAVADVPHAGCHYAEGSTSAPKPSLISSAPISSSSRLISSNPAHADIL